MPKELQGGQAGYLSRREVLGGAAGAAIALPTAHHLFARPRRDDPHYFLHVCVSGGIDASYLFDARPLAFTDRGIMQNYLYKNALDGSETLADPTPITFTGTNGTTTLRTSLVDDLMQYQPYFTVLNGVMMSPDFNGHGSNMYYLFGNNAAGPADSFMPKIGATNAATPLESIHIGGWEGDGNLGPTNFGSSVQMGSGQGSGLGAALAQARHMNFGASLYQHIHSRMQKLAQGQGRFSAGANKLRNALELSPGLHETLESVVVASSADEDAANVFLSGVDAAFEYFRNDVTSAITVMYDRDPVIDVHAASGAQGQLTLYREIAAGLTGLFDKLINTEYAEGRSMLDVTTVLVSSEFSRTMRQDGVAIDATGTDHNQLTNSILLAGKGIKPGMVVGASDCQELDEQGNIANISAAHLAKDSTKKMIMGKPFDFESMRPREDLPDTFAVNDYLGMPSIANTIMHMFGLEREALFRTGANTAPILHSVLQS